jgi:hypothetical protein
MIEKLKVFFNKNNKIIIGILLALLILKSCQTCNTTRQIEYNDFIYNTKIDSMQNIIDSCHVDSKHLNDTIYLLCTENFLLKETINDLKEDKKHFQTTNKNLTNIAKTLSKKDTIKN